jgi:5'-AMP-activated protein kinase, regulatory gamma subunit
MSLQFQVLAKYRILSAPIISSTANQGGAAMSTSADPQSAVGQVHGFIDVRDILSSFLKVVNMEDLKNAKMLKRMRILEEQGIKFSNTELKDIMSLGSDGSFYSIDAFKELSLYDVIYNGFLNSSTVETANAFGGGTRPRTVVHRLALYDQNGALTQIISQSDIMRYLYENKDALGALKGKKICDLGLVKGQVISVPPETPALDAMILMNEKNIGALAVVNNKGAIIGNFSVSELRTIMAEHFGSLSLPVGEFLALEHGTEMIWNRDVAAVGESLSSSTIDSNIQSTASYKFVSDKKAQRRDSHPGSEVGQKLITCKPDSTIGEVLEMLVLHRLHRVYVCEMDDLVPKGVLTLTDLLRYFSDL